MVWDGTFGSLERDTFPEIATLAIPAFGVNFLMIEMRYRDGKLSRKLND